MAINHYESGQKVDVQYSAIKANLQPIKQQFMTTANYQYFDEIVPTGKAWTLIGATLSRTNTGLMQLSIRDTSSISVDLDSVTGIFFPFQSAYRFSMPSGWRIRSHFGAGTSGVIKSQILVEEINEY